MNQLNKLIEQYEREFGDAKSPNGWTDDFVLWFASRPTCGVEQRLFLDEVEELEYENGVVFNSDADSIFHEDDFDSDIQKVIKGE